MRYYLCFIIITMSLFGCSSIVKPIPEQNPQSGLYLTDKKLVDKLPAFVTEQNQVIIADIIEGMDPTTVIGSLIKLNTGTFRAMDNYLIDGAKVDTSTSAEVLFHDLVENSLVINTGLLSFLQTEVSEKCKAEVTILKSAKVTAPIRSFNLIKLRNKINGIPDRNRDDFGIIIGYMDYVISASLFRDSGLNTGIEGYGAKIGGKWYSKAENTKAYHRLVAIWSPLPFVEHIVAQAAIHPESVKKIAKKSKEKREEMSVKEMVEHAELNLEQETKVAINAGTIKPSRLQNLKLEGAI